MTAKAALSRRARILLVDDHPGLLRLLTIRLKSEGFGVAACESAAQALTAIPRFQPDVVVTDLRMSEMDGIALLKELQRKYPALPVIVLTAHGTIPDAVTATQSGAFAFLTKPVEKEQLLEQLNKALKVSGFAAVTEDWRSGIITRSPLMEACLSQALMAAGSDSPVLITGPTGAGKALMARAVHRASARCGGRLSILDCATATPESFEAAWQGRREESEAPRPPEAPVGSLFLDEVSALPLPIQTTLVGLLDAGDSAGPGVPHEARILAGTSRPLPELVAQGRFREDLQYRLSVVRIDLPPLAQRREDIPLLAAHFLDEHAGQSGVKHVLAPEAVELLMAAEWPGNVQQLSSLLRQVMAVTTGPVISAELMQRSLGSSAAPQVSTYNEAREEFMRNYLVQLMQMTGGNVTQAAKLAGRNRTDFYKLLNRHSIQPDTFKQ